MDEKLRLVIEMQNKASAELRKFGKDLEGVKPGAGAKATANWFQQLESASTASTKALRPLSDGLNTIGVSGLAAGLSITGLISQFRDLAKALPALQELSRQSGISKTELERLQYAASKLHLDPSKITGAIQSFSREMIQFSMQSGDLYGEMQNGAAGLAQKIAKEWKDHPEQALKDYLSWLAAIPDAQKAAGKSAQEGVQKQRYFAGKMFGDEDVAQLLSKGMGGLSNALDEAAKRVHPVTDEMEAAAEKFDESITNFNTTWSNFKNDIGPSFLDPLAAALDKLDGAMNLAAKYPGDAAAVAGTIAAAVVALRYQRRIMAGSKIAGGSGLDRAAGEMTGAAAQQKAAATTFAEAVAEFKAKGGPAGSGAGGGAAEPGKPSGTSPGYNNLTPGGILAALQVFDLAGRAPDELRKLQENPDKDAASPEVEFAAKLGDTVRGWFKSGASPSAAGYHPDDDRLSRARVSDAPDHSLDSFVVGSLDKPVTHLVGTLKTAAAALDGNVRPAAFHPAGGPGLTAALDPEATIAAGTRRGFVEAFREIQGMSDLDGKGAGGSNFTPAAFHMGGVPGGRSLSAAGRAPNLRYGRQHEGAPYDDGGGATPTGAHTPLKDLIAAHETGGTGAAGYDTVYGHAEQPNSKMHALAPPKPVTQMTIGEILAYQREMKARAHSEAFPVGRAQWVERTLRTITHGMDPNTVFTPEVQEKLFDRSIAGRMGQGVGGFQSEWDSLRHVDAGTIQSAIEGHRAAMAKAAPVASSGPRGAYPDWMDDKSKREMAGINAPLARDLIAASEKTGTHFRILQGMRSEAEAAHNAFTGRGVVNSQHRWGAAADIKLTDAQGHDLDRGGYGNFAQAFQAYSKAHGGNSRWLGGIGGRWSSDIAHFDQGIGYGQSHQRDPYGTGGPTADDVKAGAFEIFRSSANPFMKAAKPLGDAADKLKAAVAPMPEVKPEPPRIDATAGQRAALDPIELNIRHHRDGRTSVAAKHGEGVKVSLRTAPTMVQTA